MAEIRLAAVGLLTLVVSLVVPALAQTNEQIRRDAAEVRKLIRNQVDPNERKRWEEETLRQYERDTGTKVDRSKLKQEQVISTPEPRQAPAVKQTQKQTQMQTAGGSWLTWKKGDLLGLDKNLPVSGFNEVEQFSVPFIVDNATGGFKKRRSITVQ